MRGTDDTGRDNSKQFGRQITILGEQKCIRWDEYVGEGVVPDVEVWPTRHVLAANHDVVLERAVEFLSN